MSINVLVNGATGRMGQAACQAITVTDGLTLVATPGRHEDLAASIKASDAHVVVDVTVASIGFSNAQTIINAGVCPVIATSGFTEQQVKVLQKTCLDKQLGGVIAPNFSIGAVLMMQFAKQAAKYFPQVEIIERHHENKQDAPSGTALRTAEMIRRGQAKANEPIICEELFSGARGATYQGVSIHSLRLPGSVAHQEVIFGGEGETLSIKHDSLDRQCFMPGIMLACKKVVAMKALVFGLEHLLA